LTFHRILQFHPIPVRALDDATSHVLNDRQLAKLAPVAKPIKLGDGGGLYLHCLPSGVRTWRMKYRVQGKPDEVTIGRYPDVTLAEARADAAALRRLLAAGTDPKVWAVERETEARRVVQHQAETFAAIADSYYATKAPGWSATHRRDVRRILDELSTGKVPDEAPAHAGIGDVPIRDLRKSHIRPILEAVVGRGAHSYVRDLLMYTRNVVAFFNAGHDDPIADPTAGLRATLPAGPDEQHHQSLDADEMPAFLRAIRLVSCEPENRLGLRLLLLTAVRTGELREAQWSEFDLAGALWTIPAHRMKYRRQVKADHLVPLSAQALTALTDLKSLTGRKTLILPGQVEGKPISDNTLLAVIKRAGYSGRMTGHGCRSVFSTWANENKFHGDAIERQLSHIENNRVRGAYNNAEHMAERVALMRAWGAQIATWEAGSSVPEVAS
jgi:integrase